MTGERDPPEVADRPEGAGCVADGVAHIGRQSLALPDGLGRDGPAQLLVRPEELTVGSAAAPPPGALRGRIADVDFAGPVVALTVEVEDVPIRALALSPGVLADPSLVPGADAWLSVTMDGVQLLASD